MSAVAGEAMTAPITAAIVIFRAAQWFVPIRSAGSSSSSCAAATGASWEEAGADAEAERRGGRGGLTVRRASYPPRLSVAAAARTVAGPARRS